MILPYSKTVNKTKLRNLSFTSGIFFWVFEDVSYILVSFSMCVMGIQAFSEPSWTCVCLSLPEKHTRYIPFVSNNGLLQITPSTECITTVHCKIICLYSFEKLQEFLSFLRLSAWKSQLSPIVGDYRLFVVVWTWNVLHLVPNTCGLIGDLVRRSESLDSFIAQLILSTVSASWLQRQCDCYDQALPTLIDCIPNNYPNSNNSNCKPSLNILFISLLSVSLLSVTVKNKNSEYSYTMWELNP